MFGFKASLIDAIGGSARSDVIMLVHTQVGQKTTILSFPRDLWVNIPGHGQNKINASFEGGISGGGPELVAKTIHDLTGLRISQLICEEVHGTPDKGYEGQFAVQGPPQDP